MGLLNTLYAQAAADAGGALAFDGSGGPLTYADLLARVDRLADRLSRAGAVPGLRIGVADDLGADLHTVVLAVSALDCSIVPYLADGRDGEHQRLDRLGVWGTVAAGQDAPVVVPADAARAPRRAAQAEAYVLSTSGSTSAPKDVAVSERNLESYAGHLRAVGRMVPGDRTVQNYQPLFDPFYEVLMMAALGRATVVVPEGREHMLVQRFCERWGITVWNSVPSQVTMAHRLRQLAPGSLPGVRTAVFGGEALSPRALELWRAAAPASMVVNSYGPSEVTIACAEFELPPGRRLDGDDIPIGRVLPHLEGRLVAPDDTPDEHELCIRGAQLFDGYLDPRDNAGRFYRDEGDGRLRILGEETPSPSDWYRTGDIVEDTHEGLVYRRRIGHETKVRGKRVDLSAVEAELGLLPGVTDVRALVLDDALHAVVETADPDAALPEPTGLREYARPRTLVRVTSLPRLSNGKTDLRAIEQLVRQTLDTPARTLTTTPGGTA